MRIISGKNKGTKLYTLDGINTRPTLDRVKEPLFSIIQNYIEDAVVLDLFSGSGALGLESLSRGAKKAYLCDNSKQAISIISKNIEKTKQNDNAVLLNDSYISALKKCIAQKIKFDIVFLDPPYESDFAQEATKIILENGLLAESGILIIETDCKCVDKIKYELQDYARQIFDERKYGRVSILFIKL